MRIYLYNENCIQGGQVAGVVDDETARMVDVHLSKDEDDDAEDLAGVALGDCHEEDGTEEALIEQAKARLAVRYDTRAGGAGDIYAWRCKRNVLQHLGVETVWDDASGRFVIAGAAFA